ncbi:MAG: tetratricopeptide repeat protein [Saprospiraceae bacterium]|nr:tetratricopeptide repeat protein [Saprospiraceae bacterium]
MFKKSLSIYFLLLIAFSGFGQENKLAAEYFRTGEYEKSAALYFNLYKTSLNVGYFTYYYKSLLFSEKYEEALKAVQKHLERKPGDIQLYVWEGYLYEKTGKQVKAEKFYRKGLEMIGKENLNVINVANAFLDLAKYDLAIEAYEKGALSGFDKSFYYKQIGDIYSFKGENDKMMDYYLTFLKEKPEINQSGSIKSSFARQLGKSDFLLLESKLITQIQENPDNVAFIDLLSWVYIQGGNYEKAYRQITALDRRFNEDGNKIYSLAEDAKRAEQYQMAAKSYKYIIDNKEPNSPYYMIAASNYLSVMSNLIKLDTNTTREDLLQIENLYNKFIGIYSVNSRSVFLILGLAELNALYLNDIDKAISLLQDLLNRGNIDIENKAKAKLALGDYYLIKGEVWEASLLYSQVDKAFLEGELGEIARYKNGRLYYYNGDFEWAQIIFDILKPATSRMISNDAIETSVFITETMGEDSVSITLTMFAASELLIFQNRFEEAMSKLDSINFLFTDNNLEDDIWFQKAEIFRKLKNFDLAKKMYEQIINKYPVELKADNAIFELAGLFENVYGDKEKAKQLYEKLFLDYPFSTLAIESRKKFRQLNGEVVQ